VFTEIGVANNIKMKVRISKPINPFGGLNFVLKTFCDLGIDKILDSHLPPLPSQSKYKWSDILYTFWSIYFCGGDCVEDCNENFGSFLKECRFLSPCSPDRILDRFKQLADVKIYPTSKRSQAINEFSTNQLLNDLCIKIFKQTCVANDKNLVLDYDNTHLICNKADSKRMYNRDKGYVPGVGSIDNQVIFVENRNGNSAARTFQEDTIARLFELLKTAVILIEHFRADSASYQWEVIKLLQDNVRYFYLAAVKKTPVRKAIASINEWQLVPNSTDEYIGETTIRPCLYTAKTKGQEDDSIPCRLIVSKKPRKDKQLDAFTQEAFIYHAIVTNNKEMTARQVIEFYNQRGKSEKVFDVLKNDFGWKKMPFSKIEQNTVFLILSAICNNLYQYVIRTYSEKFRGLKKTFRIKKFIFRFICIPAKWIKRSRQPQIVLFGNILAKEKKWCL